MEAKINIGNDFANYKKNFMVFFKIKSLGQFYWTFFFCYILLFLAGIANWNMLIIVLHANYETRKGKDLETLKMRI